MLRLPRLLDSTDVLARFRCGHVGGWGMKVLRAIANEPGRDGAYRLLGRA
jgi:hypothetical protein